MSFRSYLGHETTKLIQGDQVHKIGFINKKTGIPIDGGAKAHYDTK